MVFLFLALLMVFSMTCAMTESFTVTDMFDREATLEGPFTRIVVLDPADCEILCTPGCEEALVGAALSLCGAAMQGLLRNPLADVSTLDVSSGTALGAVVALAFVIGVPYSDNIQLESTDIRPFQLFLSPGNSSNKQAGYHFTYSAIMIHKK